MASPSASAPESQSQSVPSPPTVPFFKKPSKKSRPSSLRKRNDDDATSASASTSTSSTLPSTSASTSKRKAINAGNEKDEDDEEGGAIIKKQKRTRSNHLVQGTGKASFRKSKTGRGNSSSDSEDDLTNLPSSILVTYSSTNTLVPKKRDRSLSPEGTSKSEAGGVVKSGKVGTEDGLYHGEKAVGHQLPTGGNRFGPQKAGPGNVRTITLVDYQPDVCKDYKETGFCGFGDTCKFLHDRGDYIRGWEVDNMFVDPSSKGAGVAAGKGGRGEMEGFEDEEMEEIPFACLICRKVFDDPVVTKCGHYFCSSCAIKRFSKTPKCFACGAATGGIFNKAEKILHRLKLKQQAALKRREDAANAAADGDAFLFEGLEDRGNVDPEATVEDEGEEREFEEEVWDV